MSNTKFLQEVYKCPLQIRCPKEKHRNSSHAVMNECHVWVSSRAKSFQLLVISKEMYIAGAVLVFLTATSCLITRRILPNKIMAIRKTTAAWKHLNKLWTFLEKRLPFMCGVLGNFCLWLMSCLNQNCRNTLLSILLVNSTCW